MTQILVYGSIFQNQREWIMKKSDWLGENADKTITRAMIEP